MPFGAATPFGIRGYWPMASPDQLTLVYGGDNPATMTDLYVATRTSTADAFGNATRLDALSTPDLETAPYIVGSTLYFTRQPVGLAKIVVASWPGAEPIREVDELMNTGECCAVLSRDQRAMYFARGADIYYAQRSRVDDRFLPPLRVEELATAQADNPTDLSADQCRLYFESDRTGTFDLYVAEREP